MQALIRAVRTALLTVLVLTGTTALSIRPAAAAEPASSDQSTFATLGTDGIGLGYAQRFSPYWGARASVSSGLSLDADDAKLHGNRYDAKLKTGMGVRVLADLYPIRDSGFRVSGGVYIARQKLDLDGRNNASYSFNGHTYSSSQIGHLSGETKYRAVSPYLGIGWESGSGTSGWHFVSDLGVRYLGTSSSRLDASGAATNATLRNDLAKENDHLKKNSAELIASIGVSYAF